MRRSISSNEIGISWDCILFLSEKTVKFGMVFRSRIDILRLTVRIWSTRCPQSTPNHAQNPCLPRCFWTIPPAWTKSYFQHMRFAFGFAALLAVAAGAALVHAVIPALCKTTASTILRRLHARLSHRHAQ